MPSTRSSARQADQEVPSNSPSTKASAGTKRKVDDESSSPSANQTKRGRPSKDQKTLEEAMPTTSDAPDMQDEEMAEGETNGHGEDSNGQLKQSDSIDEPGESFKGENKDGESKEDPEKALKDSRGGPGLNALDQVKADENDAGKTNKDHDNDEKRDEEHDETHNGQTNGATQGNAIKEDKQREEAMPSNILEKGLIYFFSRGRVGVDDPDSVQDLARSYFVLRPLPAGAKLTDGTIQDLGNNRLIALPKKVWPKSGKDRFMAFVEKGNTTIETLKEEFFSGSEYSTKTVGTRQTPGVTPLGEGVYAITSTGSGRPTSHLVYMLTIPEKLGEVQSDVGLAEKGSFVVSLKNPESSGPAYAQLPEKPEYPKEFIEEFSGRGWMPAEPKHLDYANAQVLLIGEDFESSSNLEAAAKDEKNDEKETPQEELEKLENEDEHRIENLKGDDSIFDDLGISKKEFPKVMTTW